MYPLSLHCNNRVKKIKAIVALLGIMLQTFSQVVIVAAYYAQKDYIAKNLCENRNKPQMHCDGKCCLKKKLAKQGKEQAPAPGNQKEEVTLFYSDARCEAPLSFSIPALKEYFTHNECGTIDYHGSVFHPPASMV